MFCDNLVSLRKLHDLSQEELADRLQVSRQTLSKYETGEACPTLSAASSWRKFSTSRWTISSTMTPPLPG